MRFKETHPGWECYGVDPSLTQAMVALGNERHVHLIPDYYDTGHFDGMVFDVVIAHGLLNRTPTLPELIKINRHCRPGTLVSLELMFLEDSECVPYIWDHSHVCTRPVFEKYLQKSGFEPMESVNMGATWHYLCRCDTRATETPPADVTREEYNHTRNLYESHLQWWENVKSNCTRFIGDIGTMNLALFGAGMYSGVLMNLLAGPSDALPVQYIIDEMKQGGDLFGVPVVGLEEASGLDIHVGLCVRPAYLDIVRQKLEGAGLRYTVLNPGHW